MADLDLYPGFTCNPYQFAGLIKRGYHRFFNKHMPSLDQAFNAQSKCEIVGVTISTHPRYQPDHQPMSISLF